MANPLFLTLLLARPRLQRTQLLLHPTRRAIVDVVRERPGITVGEAQARVGVPFGTFHHHLTLLRFHGFIDAQNVGRRCVLHLPGAATVLDNAARAMLRGHAVREVARAIDASPGGSVADIARVVERPLRTVYHHVERLVESGLVRSRSPTRRFELEPTERLTRILRELR